MPIDPRTQKFLDRQWGGEPEAPARTLGDGPVTKLGAQRSAAASDRILEYRQREYVEKTGRIAEEILGFILERREGRDWLDDEVIGGVALVCINMRESFGQPQHETDDARWTPEYRAEQLKIFDTICVEMQAHFDRNKHKNRDEPWEL